MYSSEHCVHEDCYIIAQLSNSCTYWSTIFFKNYLKVVIKDHIRREPIFHKFRAKVYINNVSEWTPIIRADAISGVTGNSTLRSKHTCRPTIIMFILAQVFHIIQIFVRDGLFKRPFLIRPVHYIFLKYCK